MSDKTFKASAISAKKPWRTPDFNPNVKNDSFTPYIITSESAFLKDKDFFDIKDFAINNAVSTFPEEITSQKERDAYRHILWSGMLANKYGQASARLIGKLHESKLPFVGSPMQSEAENKMDLYNNELGLSLGSKVKSIDELREEAKNIILSNRAKLDAKPGTY